MRTKWGCKRTKQADDTPADEGGWDDGGGQADDRGWDEGQNNTVLSAGSRVSIVGGKNAGQMGRITKCINKQSNKWGIRLDSGRKVATARGDIVVESADAGGPVAS